MVSTLPTGRERFGGDGRGSLDGDLLFEPVRLA